MLTNYSNGINNNIQPLKVVTSKLILILKMTTIFDSYCIRGITIESLSF